MTSVDRVLRNQVRGVTGALVVSGVTMLLTAELWWLAAERPPSHLIVYAVVGLTVVLLVTRSSGFRVEEEGDRDPSRYDPVRLGVDFAQLVLQSVVAAVGVLALYGVVDSTTSPHLVARMVLLLVVPLGFGAALANRLLRETQEQRDRDSADEQTLRENVSVFAAGAIFFTMPLGASLEMRVLATTAGWARLAAVLVTSVILAYLILYELEFRGQSRRTRDWRWAEPTHVGEACVVVAVGAAVSTLLLWGFGYLTYSPVVDAQLVVVLTFPTTVGGAAARVVL